MSFAGRHIISISDFTKADLDKILDLAAELEARPQPQLLSGKVMATCFFEPSTRTRLSFESAMKRLGGNIIGFTDATSTSAKKGESLADTIRMNSAYADIIVMRHPQDGAARLASEVSSVPIINGGDGSNQHPTQTCLDLYSIREVFPNWENPHGEELHICFAGDLRYGRTVHSLLTALCHYPVRMSLCAPKGLEMPPSYVKMAEDAGITVDVIPNLSDAALSCDILYMTRLQEERFPDPIEFDHVKNSYRLDANTLKKAKQHLRVLHPLPRVNEIATDVDHTKHAYYFDQAANGIPVRQALIALTCGARS